MSQWTEHLARIDRNVLARVAIEVVRTLMDEWVAARPNDKRPLKALEAAEQYLDAPGENTEAYARAAARACTAARKDSLGYEHRIAEAARAVARAALARDDKATIEAVVEAISRTEEHILYRYSIDAVYDKEPEVRSELLGVIRKTVFESPRVGSDEQQEKPEAGPVAYSASASFEIGQKIAHQKFGICKVINASERWIEIETEVGETKKLSHRRK